MPTPIDDLLDTDHFQRRHLGPRDADVAHMLAVLGVESAEELMRQTMPDSIVSAPIDVHPARSETEALDALRATAARNEVVTSLIGMGYHGTITPPVIARNVLEDPA